MSVEIHNQASVDQQEPSKWRIIIRDLMAGADFNYSRIAYRIRCSPSTIQKLDTNHKRKPRKNILSNLTLLYHKIFYGQYTTLKAQAYIRAKEIERDWEQGKSGI